MALRLRLPWVEASGCLAGCFCGQGFVGAARGLRSAGLFFGRCLTNGEGTCAFSRVFWADASDGKQVVDGFECAVGFAGVQNF